MTSESIDDFVATLAKPRTAIGMIQAGPRTDAVIEQLDNAERAPLRVDARRERGRATPAGAGVVPVATGATGGSSRPVLYGLAASDPLNNQFEIEASLERDGYR